MCTTSRILRIIIPVFSFLFCANAYSEQISVQGRAAPRSGIEQMQFYCLLQVETEASTDIYGQFPELAGMLESALNRNFQAKGFQDSKQGACEIEMHYAISVQEQSQLSERRFDGKPVRATTDRAGKLRRGSVTLNAYDEKSNRKVWTGKATNTEGVYVDLVKTADEDIEAMRQRVNTGIDKLFLRFPKRAQ